MYYNDLPPEIQRKVDEYTTSRILNDNMSSRFVFSSSPEGHDFWSKIRSGDFKVFYERYPKFQNIPEIKRALRLNKLPSEFTPEQIRILEEKNIKYQE